MKGTLYPMLDVESSLRGLTNPTIDCLTFFEGAPPVAAIKARIMKMVEKNPWLVGRLKGASDGEVHFFVPSTVDMKQVERVTFRQAQIDSLRPDMDPMEAIKDCAPYGAKLGLECVDKDEALFKVCLMHAADGKFALLVSLCHTLGDAATFYKLYGMLAPDGPEPEAINFARVPSFHVAALRDSFGAEAVGGHTKLACTEPKGIKETLQMYNAIIKAPARFKQPSLVKIDDSWIARQKEATAAECKAAGVDFLSTNDLLVAWYFSAIGASHGTIACDCRGRSPDVPAANIEFKPGNYISSVFTSAA